MAKEKKKKKKKKKDTKKKDKKKDKRKSTKHKDKDRQKKIQKLENVTVSLPENGGEPLFEFQRKAQLQEKMKRAAAEAQRAEMEQQASILQWQKMRSGAGTIEPSKQFAAVAATTRSVGPVTKKTHETTQATVRDVFDPQTGRVRRVRGDGEIIEAIVSKEEQQRIQFLSTRWDGRMSYGATA